MLQGRKQKGCGYGSVLEHWAGKVLHSVTTCVRGCVMEAEVETGAEETQETKRPHSVEQGGNGQPQRGKSQKEGISSYLRLEI